jgi:hypothetical protein
MGLAEVSGRSRTPLNEPQEAHAWPSRPREAKGLGYGIPVPLWLYGYYESLTYRQ